MKLPTMKQYPKTITIGNEEYKIRFVAKIRRDKSCVGLCDPETREIFIRKDLSSPDKFATLIHEVLHAVEAEYEIKIPHKTIYALDRALIDLLLQNF